MMMIDYLVNELCVVSGLQGGHQVMRLLISMIKGMHRMLFMNWMVCVFFPKFSFIIVSFLFESLVI
jgi:hypothetical protein